MNIVMLTGRVGSDLVLTESNGTNICKFPLATSDGTKDNPITNWHNIVAFGKTAEILSSYVKKGEQLSLSGNIKNTTYEKNGENRFYSQIIVSKFTLISNK